MLNFKSWFSHHAEDNVKVGHVTQRYYTNPYLIGLLLGLVLLFTFIIMGRGLGASGALSAVVAVAVNEAAPTHASNNEFYKGYLGDGSQSPLKDWLVFSIIGAMVGGFISGAISGRNKITIEKGPRANNKQRFIYAFIGGALMGIGAKFARGCTSGQALTGGAMLSVGAWAFMLMVFAGAYAMAYFMRRQWL